MNVLSILQHKLTLDHQNQVNMLERNYEALIKSILNRKNIIRSCLDAYFQQKLNLLIKICSQNQLSSLSINQEIADGNLLSITLRSKDNSSTNATNQSSCMFPSSCPNLLSLPMCSSHTDVNDDTINSVARGFSAQSASSQNPDNIESSHMHQTYSKTRAHAYTQKDERRSKIKSSRLDMFSSCVQMESDDSTNNRDKMKKEDSDSSSASESSTDDEENNSDVDWRQKRKKKTSEGVVKVESAQKTSDTKNGDLLPNQCPKCLRVFASKWSVKVHVQRVHEKIKNIECEHCGKKFFARKDVVRHTANIHTAETPFKCNICGKKYKTKYTLANHVNSKHKSNGHNRKASRQTNMKANTEKPFKCPQCLQKFVNEAKLKLHLKASHSSSSTSNQ